MPYESRVTYDNNKMGCKKFRLSSISSTCCETSTETSQVMTQEPCDSTALLWVPRKKSEKRKRSKRDLSFINNIIRFLLQTKVNANNNFFIVNSEKINLN